MSFWRSVFIEVMDNWVRLGLYSTTVIMSRMRRDIPYTTTVFWVTNSLFYTNIIYQILAFYDASAKSYPGSKIWFRLIWYFPKWDLLYVMLERKRNSNQTFRSIKTWIISCINWNQNYQLYHWRIKALCF